MTKALRFAIILFSAILFISAVSVVSVPSEAYAEDVNDEESIIGKYEYDDWDSLIETFLTDNKCYDGKSVALGFYNTVTGEEHYYRGDVYMETASLYKVPLNMVYAERIYNGEMDFDTKIWGASYRILQEGSIINSDNEYATILWKNLGTYKVFRDLITPYIGVDLENVDPIYYKNRYFTSEQVITFLRTLYEDPERFPGIIDCMLKAEPKNYFCFHPQKYPIAHKYGYLGDGYYVCDCGICYTEEPILISMFTAGVRHPNDLLADYCTLMCEYAERSAAARQNTPPPEEDPPLVTEAIPEDKPVEEEAASPVYPAQEQIPEEAGKSAEADGSEEPAVKNDIQTVRLLICSYAAGIAGLFCVIAYSVKKKSGLLFGVFAVAFILLAVLTCITGNERGVLYTRTDGDPQSTVTGFFDSIVSGDLSRASDYLDAGSVGFFSDINDEDSRVIYDALKNSYSYELSGPCEVSGLSAMQPVRFTYLNVPDMESDIFTEANNAVEQMVQDLPADEIYDENGDYLSEFIETAYRTAVDKVLSESGSYYKTELFEIKLSYKGSEWLITSAPGLMTALSGGS